MSHPGRESGTAAGLTSSDTARWDRPTAAPIQEEERERTPLLRRDAAGSQPGVFEKLCRRLVLDRFARLARGQLVIEEAGRTHRFGDASGDPAAVIRVRAPRFWRRLVLGGSLGAAEAYIEGSWDCDDLASVMCVLARNLELLFGMDGGVPLLARPVRRFWHALRRNTLAGSRRNISAHYDLSNDFFALMLDPTMTYSSGIFATPDDTLEQASRNKYERICRKLQLSPGDHVLEIGSGWGGFALHAAGRYGCRVTTTTISREQYEFARERVVRAGLDDLVELKLVDYRRLSGQYDKLVSIEMIEAVGEKFLDAYFGQCSRLLRSDGMLLLQAITIPDHRYDRYRYSVDFIQQYVFPGGFLPSFSAMGQSLRRATDFRWFHSEDLGPHYAQTLAHWRENFWSRIESVRELGFDQRFIRTWDYYLCYCQAGFRERHVGVSQILLTKPDCRRTDLATTGIGDG